MQRIRDIGEHHSLTDASLALSEAHNLLGLVLAHFKACTKKDDRLKKYEADAMSFQRALRDVRPVIVGGFPFAELNFAKDMCELLTTATEDVNHELSKLEAELAAAIQKVIILITILSPFFIHISRLTTGVNMYFNLWLHFDGMSTQH